MKKMSWAVTGDGTCSVRSVGLSRSAANVEFYFWVIPERAVTMLNLTHDI